MLADKLARGLVGANGGGILMRGSGVSVGSSREGSSTDGDDLDAVVGLDSGDGVTGIDGANKGVGALDTGDVRDLGDIQESSSAGHDVLSKCRVRGNQVSEAELLLGLDQQRSVGLGEGVGEGGVLGDKDLGDAGELGDLVNHRLGGVAGNKSSDGSTEGGGGGEGVQGRG